MTAIAVGAIEAYRRYLSPYKGFRCAHNVLHQCGSCSDFGLRVYRRLDVRSATALMLRRLNECRTAYAAILAMTAEAGPGENEETRTQKKRGDATCWPLDALNCVSTPLPDAACLDAGGCEIFSCAPW